MNTAHNSTDAVPPECAVALDMLHRRLDGDIVDVPSAVAAHVAGCPDCRGRFASTGRLVAALAGSESVSVPALVTERIVADVLADARRRRRLRHCPAAAGGLAAAVGLAVWLSRL